MESNPHTFPRSSGQPHHLSDLDPQEPPTPERQTERQTERQADPRIEVISAATRLHPFVVRVVAAIREGELRRLPQARLASIKAQLLRLRDPDALAAVYRQLVRIARTLDERHAKPGTAEQIIGLLHLILPPLQANAQRPKTGLPAAEAQWLRTHHPSFNQGVASC